MQNSQCWNFAVQSSHDGIEMLRALRQHEDLTALLVRILDLRRNRDVPRRIAGDVPKNILNARFLWQINPRVQCARRDGQIVWRACRFRGGMACWPALHENNRLPAIATNRCGSQAKHIFRFGLFQDRLERLRAQVMTFIDNDLPIVCDQRVDFTLAG